MTTPPRLPPLNALRAFEAVARHRSFRKAAAELFVTPAAVTHQIKALEEQLGVELFKRLPGGVELTPATLASLPVLQRGFELIARSVGELRNYGSAPHLTVRATPTFASRWMMPRLHSFLAVHQGIDVRVLASGNLLNSAGRPAAASAGLEPDIDIRFHNGVPEGDHVDLLFNVGIVPMCHPRLIEEGSWPLKEPADLAHHSLLHGDMHIADRAQSAWSLWLRKAGVSNVDPRRGLQFDHPTLALDAAADGLGVTLATPMFAKSELERGDVVIAFPIEITLERSYYAITAPASAQRPEVIAFRQWLLNEAAANPQGAAVRKKKRPRSSSRPE